MSEPDVVDAVARAKIDALTIKVAEDLENEITDLHGAVSWAQARCVDLATRLDALEANQGPRALWAVFDGESIIAERDELLKKVAELESKLSEKTP